MNFNDLLITILICLSIIKPIILYILRRQRHTSESIQSLNEDLTWVYEELTRIVCMIDKIKRELEELRNDLSSSRDLY